ncbi:MAG: sensor histidine kinase [Archangium sp.]
MNSHERTQSETQLGLSWLIALRWGAVAGQLATLAFVRLALQTDQRWGVLLALVASTALTNVALLTVKPQAPKWLLPVVLSFDVVTLTGLLAASGGITNPFTVFFFVHVALAALFDGRAAQLVAGLTVLAFSLLCAAAAADGAAFTSVVGSWVAYVLGTSFVAYFVSRVSRALRGREQRLARLTAQNERLATLSSFSANAAHELGSPLATIAVAAGELSSRLRREKVDVELLSDAELVRAEVARCRRILVELSARSGEAMGEMPERAALNRVVDELKMLLAPPRRDALQVSYQPADAHAHAVNVPVKTLAQVLNNLVRNAFEAQGEAGHIDAPVELQIVTGERPVFRVLDRGAGIAPEVSPRLGEPFVTTKGENGLGLGIYLARATAERLGGALRLNARAGGGTVVEFDLAEEHES